MQINGLSISPTSPLIWVKASQPTEAASDKAELNVSPSTFSSLVHQAGSMPEVRSEVVNAFKARVQSGEYPSPQVVSGLADVIGGSIMNLATVGAE